MHAVAPTAWARRSAKITLFTCGRRNRMRSLISVACENKFSKQKNPNPSPLQRRSRHTPRRAIRAAARRLAATIRSPTLAVITVTESAAPAACCPRRRWIGYPTARRRRRPPAPPFVRGRSALGAGSAWSAATRGGRTTPAAAVVRRGRVASLSSTAAAVRRGWQWCCRLRHRPLAGSIRHPHRAPRF